MGEKLQVDPADLRLPPSRSVVDVHKLADQLRRYGQSMSGMPPVQVTRGRGGLLMINDGVTRATRIHRYANPGTRIEVEIIDDRPKMQLDGLARIGEL